MDYAVIPLAGSQFLVSPGDKLKVNRVPYEEGETFEIAPFLVSQGKKLEIGLPKTENFSVALKVLEHGKDKKIYVRRFKSKSRYRRKKGHRQPISVLEVLEITSNGKKSKEEKAKKTTKPKPTEKEETLKSLGLSTRTKNALKNAGKTDIANLADMSKDELLEIKGIGEKGAEEIMSKL